MYEINNSIIIIIIIIISLWRGHIELHIALVSRQRIVLLHVVTKLMVPEPSNWSYFLPSETDSQPMKEGSPKTSKNVIFKPAFSCVLFFPLVYISYNYYLDRTSDNQICMEAYYGKRLLSTV